MHMWLVRVARSSVTSTPLLPIHARAPANDNSNNRNDELTRVRTVLEGEVNRLPGELDHIKILWKRDNQRAQVKAPAHTLDDAVRQGACQQWSLPKTTGWYPR